MKLPDTRWTVDEFYEFLEEARRRGGTDFYGMYSLNERWVMFFLMDMYNCMNKYQHQVETNYDTPEFINVFEIAKKLIKNNYVTFDKADDSRVLFREKEANTLTLSMKVAYLPNITLENPYPATVDLFCINKNTKNRQLAEDFLAIFISKDVQLGIESVIASLPLQSKAWYTVFYESESVKDLPGMDVYRDILAHSQKNEFNSGLNVFAAELFEKYLEDGISAEEAVKLIDKKAKIMLNE